MKYMLCMALVLLPSLSRAENWPQWRGPDQNGTARGRGYPKQWDEATGIVWKVKVPGLGTSTPVVWEERIFLTCEDEGQNALLCLNRSGAKEWLVQIGDSAGNRNRKASGANPSPVTDGKAVYAYFRSGDVARVSFEGKVEWQTNLQEKYGRDALWWDLGTSPVLTRESLVVAVMHQGPSYLISLKATTGDVRWKHERETDAPGEARDSYTTPLVTERDGKQEIVVLGADVLTAFSAEDGSEVWRAEGLNPGRRGNFRSIASPVVAGDLVIAPYARGSTLTAVKQAGSGDVTDSHVAWSAEVDAGDVPSPASFEGKLYLCSDRGLVSCVEAATGKLIWEEALPRSRYSYSASPIVADGHLYLSCENGTAYVLKLGDEPKLVSTNVLRENTYATPVFVDQQILQRTSDYLFCIGRTAE